jgi:hypothetical protein
VTQEQREKCNALIQELADAGIEISLHKFRTVSGYRVVGMDGHSRRLQRDGEDPVALLNKMKRLFGVKEKAPQESPPEQPVESQSEAPEQPAESQSEAPEPPPQEPSAEPPQES